MHLQLVNTVESLHQATAHNLLAHMHQALPCLKKEQWTRSQNIVAFTAIISDYPSPPPCILHGLAAHLEIKRAMFFDFALHAAHTHTASQPHRDHSPRVRILRTRPAYFIWGAPIMHTYRQPQHQVGRKWRQPVTTCHRTPHVHAADSVEGLLPCSRSMRARGSACSLRLLPRNQQAHPSCCMQAPSPVSHWGQVVVPLRQPYLHHCATQLVLAGHRGDGVGGGG